MKKLIACLVAVLLLMTFPPIQSIAATEKNPVSIISEKESAEIQVLINRVNEIKAMDKSSLSSSEKKEIRKELREIKREVNRRSGDVVYISAGLLVLIIVLILIF